MNVPTLVLVLGTVLGAGGAGGLVAIAYIRVTKTKIRAEARKLDVDADDVLLGGALKMYQQAMDAAERAEKKADAAEEKADAAEERASANQKEVRALRDHVDHLESIMRDAGLTPPKFDYPRDVQTP